MRRFVGVSAILLTLFITRPATAQVRPVEINLGAGATFPTSNLGDVFDTGWNGALGVTFNVSQNVGIQAEYMYHRMNGPDRVFPNLDPGAGSDTVLIESNHQMHTGTFNLVVRSNSGGAVNGYFLAGPGIYHRIVELTSPSVGVITVCDPYWLVCYPAAVETDQILGDRSSNDFGVNFGGGLTFGGGAKFYVEFRYHYVWGPKIQPLGAAGDTGTTYSSNAQFMPLTFGFRF